MDVLIVLLATLAVYRIATDIAWTRGPANSYERLRSWVVRRWGDGSWQAEGIGCPICASFWFSLPAALVVMVVSGWPAEMWPLVWIGLAGGAAWLIRTHKDDIADI